MIQTGSPLPDATLRTLSPDGPKTVSTKDVFRGRKIVLFGVPGAYTGTCSNIHLPSFVEQADAIRAKGVDEIVCVAVNDPFVLDAWGKAVGTAGRVTLLSDGNAEFTKKIGMDFDGSGFGLGTRSKRYAMLVDDGTVTALEVEESPGVCKITDGASILKKLTADS